MKKSKIKMQNDNVKFKNKVFEIVKKIPKGKILSYKKVTELTERPGAWRAVGNILNKKYQPQNFLPPSSKIGWGNRRI